MRGRVIAFTTRSGFGDCIGHLYTMKRIMEGEKDSSCVVFYEPGYVGEMGSSIVEVLNSAAFIDFAAWMPPSVSRDVWGGRMSSRLISVFNDLLEFDEVIDLCDGETYRGLVPGIYPIPTPSLEVDDFEWPVWPSGVKEGIVFQPLTLLAKGESSLLISYESIVDEIEEKTGVPVNIIGASVEKPLIKYEPALGSNLVGELSLRESFMLCAFSVATLGTESWAPVTAGMFGRKSLIVYIKDDGWENGRMGWEHLGVNRSLPPMYRDKPKYIVDEFMGMWGHVDLVNPSSVDGVKGPSVSERKIVDDAKRISVCKDATSSDPIDCSRNLAFTPLKFRITLQIPSSCNMEPPCQYCSTANMRNEYPTPIIGTVDEWIAGARMMRERLNCGPVYFDLCFGDPFGCRETIEIAADLSRDNCVAVTTNLVAQLSDLDILPRNDNVMISPSFHPHYWDGVDQFVEKVGLIRASGLVDFGTIIVTHPSFIKMIPEWKRKMESYGIKVLPSMFFGSYQGKMYPDAFTDEERGFISEMQGGVFDGEDIDRRSGRMITKNRKCAAGVRYFFVRMDGDIRRCIMYGGSLGNLLEGTFYPLSFPEMCEIEECALCYDQWQYIEDGN